MELEIYQAFTKAGVSEADAKAAAESVNKAIDQRYALHARTLATRGDLIELSGALHKDMAELSGALHKDMAELNGALRKDMAELSGGLRTDMAEMENRLLRAVSEMQRWTITAMFAGITASAAIVKFIH